LILIIEMNVVRYSGFPLPHEFIRHEELL